MDLQQRLLKHRLDVLRHGPDLGRDGLLEDEGDVPWEEGEGLAREADGSRRERPQACGRRACHGAAVDADAAQLLLLLLPPALVLELSFEGVRGVERDPQRDDGWWEVD